MLFVVLELKKRAVLKNLIVGNDDGPAFDELAER